MPYVGPETSKIHHTYVGDLFNKSQDDLRMHYVEFRVERAVQDA